MSIANRGFQAAVVAVCLVSLVFLGSPGCGCSDDLPDRPEEPGGEDCCCEFEWTLLDTSVFDGTVDIVLVGADPSLEAFANPSVLTGVSAGEPQLFDICVQDDHTLGATVTVEFRNQADNSLLGSAQLIYDERCRPDVVVSPNALMLLWSTDCQDRCCCTFDWLAPDGVGPVVDIVIPGFDPELLPEAVPSQLTGVSELEWQSFQICINEDHNPPSQLEVQLIDAGSGALYGRAQVFYGAGCEIVGIEHIEGPNFNEDTFFSPDCQGTPKCCCTFRYEYGPDDPSAYRLAVRDADPSLEPELSVTGTISNPQTFDVCVNVDHDIDATMEVVVLDAADNVVDGMTIQWDPNCLSGIIDQIGQPGPGDPDVGFFTLESCERAVTVFKRR